MYDACPKIHAKVDGMVNERYLAGDVESWDITASRQALIGLEPPRSSGLCPQCKGRNGQRLLKDEPTLDTRKLDYEEANQAYTDKHAAGSLSDADYVEWIALVRNHQQHHADGKLEEAEFSRASFAVKAFVHGVSCLTDAQREELRAEMQSFMHDGG